MNVLILVARILLALVLAWQVLGVVLTGLAMLGPAAPPGAAVVILVKLIVALLCAGGIWLLGRAKRRS